MKNAIYAGSFDILTRGHCWVIEKAAEIFDNLYVLIAENPSKKDKYFFSLEIRKKIVIDFLKTSNINNVHVREFKDGFIAKYAVEKDIKYLVRGLRNEKDFLEERTLNYINKDLIDNNTLDTIYFITPREYEHLSSSMVRGLIGITGWRKEVGKFVPNLTEFYLLYYKFLKERYIDAYKKLTNIFNIEIAETNFDEIFKVYTNENRHFHDIYHIYDMINYLDNYCESNTIDEIDKAILEISIFYHDYIYSTDVAEYKENETLSAHEAVNSILLNIKPSLEERIVDGIYDAILATKHSEEVTNALGKILCDIDLAQWGEKYRYNENVLDIISEFSNYNEKDFFKKRKEFLLNILDKKEIFYTSYFRDKYENQYRCNIENEIKNEKYNH